MKPTIEQQFPFHQNTQIYENKPQLEEQHATVISFIKQANTI